MRVKCVGRTIADFPDGYSDMRATLKEGPFPLTVDKTYVVHTVEAGASGVQYYVHDDDDLPYPLWYAAPLFQIVDPSPSRYWVGGYYPPTELGGSDFVLSFPEWASDRFFFNDLVDGRTPARETYARYRSLIEDEPSSVSTGQSHP